jgi:hypothetical protein
VILEQQGATKLDQEILNLALSGQLHKLSLLSTCTPEIRKQP